MRIKKLRFKNGYKRFHDLTIDLGDNPARIVALVGPNGCGKSSVFDGILFVQNSHDQIGNKARREPRFHSLLGDHNFNHSNVEVSFVEGSFVDVFQQKAQLGRSKTIFSFRSSYRYNSNLKINETRAVPDIFQNNYGASTSPDLDDKMDENYRRLNVKYNQYLHDQDCRPSEAKEFIIGELNSSIQACLDLEIASIGNVEAGEGTIYFKKADQRNVFDFNVLSSGEKEVVDLLLDLYLRKDEFNDSIFLIDEPELHINTSIQRKLLVEINKLIGENCQLWVATHSVGFLRSLQEELRDQCQVVSFQAGTPWASEAITLTPIKASREEWKKIFHTALDDLTTLVAPKRIIYCEGRDEPGANATELGFDAKVYNSVFGEAYSDTHFVSSGGNTELDQRSSIAIAILSKVIETLEIWVLKDRDMASGNVVNETARQLYLSNNPPTYRVLRRYELENYLFDKEILKKYCDDKGLVFNGVAYDAVIADIVNDEVKSKTNHVRNFCNIVGSVNAETFKLNLAQYITPDTAVYNELENCIFDRV